MRRGASRAFTLVELTVAVAAGLAVATAALLLARGVSRTFQEEARMASAHVAATLGLGRLVADVQRAGFLVSPHAAHDPAVCGDRALWPQGMRRLAGITVRDGGSVVAHPADLGQSLANGIRPDALIVGGSFGNVELFPVRAIVAGAGGSHEVYLQVTGSGAMQRTLARAGTDGAGFQAIFRPGRMLRILLAGQSRALYGVIAGVDVVGSPPAQIVVRLAPSPALPSREGGGCGLGSGAHVGGLVSPVARVLYDVRRLAGHPVYGALVAPVAGEVTGDEGRTELVRVELDANDDEVPETLELVAEYAVDLQIGVTTATETGEIVRAPIGGAGEAAALALAGDPTTPGAAPERVRAVQIRLATRTRAPDRSVGLGSAEGGRMTRFLIPGIVPGVDTAGAVPPPRSLPVYARMRTLHAEVALVNQAGGMP
ncbi:hypothetical protein [Chondromyces apiculatus]|uniref:Type IV fimbrial biogenesis protein PilW n=1 Tax=Chondromyces apiculatus DSM 436 TaxID=1192034 RepID=A0A017SYQ0_9BACT|nr:hypothetical protein [Chondromyces apiculatus]EYF02094.1 Type IV fimbrial biogenesis protein PilW [Chondromyces apiculatus DSM 436]